MNITVVISTLILLMVALFACEKKRVSFESAESSRKTARENGTLNATEWRAINPEFSEFSIYARGDSTISRDCPQGDGWASIDLKKTGYHTIKLKCSTVSNAIGCMTSTDFKTKKSYANQDGKCNKEVPYPLPKMNV